MTKPRAGFFFFAFLTLITGCGKIVVTKVPPPPAIVPVRGILYALPTTVLSAQVKIDKTEVKAAPFAVFAPIFAPGAKAVCVTADCSGPKENAVVYSLQDGAAVSTYGVPDPNEVYLVHFSGSGAVDQTLALNWTEAGLISTASGTVTNRVVDTVVAGVGVAASIFAKAGLGTATVETRAAGNVCSLFVPGAEDSLPNDAWFAGEIASLPTLNPPIAPAIADALQSSYCNLSKEVRGSFPRDHSLFLRSVRAYSAKVYPLLQNQASLLGNGNPYTDVGPLLDRLSTQIDSQLASLYLGTKKVTTWSTRLDFPVITDGGSKPNDLVLLRIDPAAGVVMGDGTPGPDATPMPEDFDGPTRQAASTISLRLAYTPAKGTQLFSRVSDDTKGLRSFRYRLPAQIAVDVRDEKKSYGGGKVFIAQLGTVVSLPASRHSKSLTYTLGFVEATGGLKAFSLGTTGGLDTGTIKDAGTAAGTILDARTAAATKAATAVDPVSALTKQDTLLKLQDDICTIQKKYNLPCTIQP